MIVACDSHANPRCCHPLKVFIPLTSRFGSTKHSLCIDGIGKLKMFVCSSLVQVEFVRATPNEFFLFLGENCFVRLRAESNVVRDIITITLRAFCDNALASGLYHEPLVRRNSSTLLAVRDLIEAEQSVR